MVIFWNDNTIVLNAAFPHFLHYFQVIYDYRILYKSFYRDADF